MSQIASIETLTGSNFKKWNEHIRLVLGVMDLDYALRVDKPTPLSNTSTQEEKSAYEKWERSNRLSLMIMKGSISSDIRGDVPDSENAKDFLNSVEEQFQSSSKALATTLIIKMVTSKYNRLGGCEFLLLDMDTIVSAARECHRYIGSSKSRITSQFGSFSPSSSFRGMNYRAFNSDVAFMQSLPNKYFTIDGYSEAKSPSYSPETSKKIKRSTSIPINRKPAPKEVAFTTDLFHSELCARPADTKYAPKGSPCATDLSRSELWAGPAYTNSPPPSSLPIPKFSLRERRGVSLELPL
ncbi:hypothetical protein ZIOFF_043600 [Zingiber officinale]|uniref:Uncharacterized protein n=1 Tax=Zingiber officinale TaxID=94328 RepID=A0A8J5KQL2_ZINOF|nr:hypothetical protein ZIOFF_043600 [Zingiber officinale]